MMENEFTICKNYINIPVRNGSDKRLMRFYCEGKIIREFEIELTGEKPDFWVYTDVSGLKGKAVRITVDELTGDGFTGNRSAADENVLDQIIQSDAIKDEESIYSEKLRPQFHFSSKRGWLNDPNGLLYYKGEYHLFYQHNLYGWNWGNMHWGHAISRDLVHWEELGDALYPDEMGTMFSGAGVVDKNNTAGFQDGEEKPLILIYTAAGGTLLSKGKPFTQCIAYSNDRGRTWIKYDKNPVLEHIAGTNRDPKVVWHEPTRMWIMTLFLEKNDYAVFVSKDLKAWERSCNIQIPGCTECPDLFELPVDGDANNKKAVFWGANGSYIIGNFDGRTFTAESKVLHSNSGNCSYAAQTWNNVPEEGRCIQIAWCKQDLPGMPFNQFMTFPCELALRTTEEGVMLFTNPIEEIEKLYKVKHKCKGLILKKGVHSHSSGKQAETEHHLSSEEKSCLFDIRAVIYTGTAEEICLNVRGVPIVYKVKEQTLNCLGKSVHMKAYNWKISLRVLVDRASIEIFGNRGQVYMPMSVLLEDENRSLLLSTEGGEAVADSLEIYELKNIWNEY